MGQWTHPRKLATKTEWFDCLDHSGPACYEIGTGGPRGGNIQWHYVGETANEKQRISSYARSGSHLSRIIDWHLNQGWTIYYRAWAFEKKADAKKMQDNLLRRTRYEWNLQLNGE